MFGKVYAATGTIPQRMIRGLRLIVAQCSGEGVVATHVHKHLLEQISA